MAFRAGESERSRGRNLKEPRKSGGVDPRGWPGSAKPAGVRPPETPWLSAFPLGGHRTSSAGGARPRPQVCFRCFWASHRIEIPMKLNLKSDLAHFAKYVADIPHYVIAAVPRFV